MSWLGDRRFAVGRAIAMAFDRPGAFALAVSLSTAALALPLFVAVLSYSMLPLAPRAQQAAGAEINVFVAPGTSAREVGSLQNEVARISGVAGVRLIPRDQALAELARRSGAAFPPGDRSNPLPDVIVARFAAGIDASVIEQAVEAIGKLTSVDRVRADIEWYRRVRAAAAGVAAVVTILLGLTAALVFLVMVVAAREGAHRRSEEIAVMRLAGATPAFITRPYVYLSALTMALGALLAAAAVVAAVALVRPAVASAAQTFGATVELRTPPVWTLGAVLAASILTGAIAGWLGIRSAMSKQFSA